ncbi:hypothetical protein Nepgr_027125 [Nepenthes gracilis]|uniref:Dof zinc finger protein n=1 Tax=Nepenthes gracilis TaxID=150966 RepID=A0AAD3T9G8_NEPGR|nr:hypothetical protein Nepgr_027125 [Nepenthes gracilis]
MASKGNFPATKDEIHQSSGDGGGGCVGRNASSSRSPRPDQEPLKCPRCDSLNTKFCYYNNYSLAQPRHFCKTCRRYWTRGGALRNVPFGRGCRKNKKNKPSSRPSAHVHLSEELDFGGFKFFHGLPIASDFRLGNLSLPRTGLCNRFLAFTDIEGLDLRSSSSSSSTSFVGFTYPSAAAPKQVMESISGFSGTIQEGFMNGNGILASSIESLSTINQEIHLKLQQQRLATLYGVGGENNYINNHKESVSTISGMEKPQPILFQNLEMPKSSRKDGAAEWFFGSPFAAAQTNSGGNNIDNITSSCSNGVEAEAWTDGFHQFNGCLN